MARTITRDPREYRRGMVLGLTLAETVLMLLFLLLLATAALMLQMLRREQEAIRRAEAAEAALQPLRPVLDAIVRQGVAGGTESEVMARLLRGEAAIAETRRLAEQLTEAAARLAAAEAAAQEAARLRERLTRAESLRAQAEAAAREAHRQRQESEQAAARLQAQLQARQQFEPVLAEAQARARDAERRRQEAEQAAVRLEAQAARAQAQLAEADERARLLGERLQAAERDQRRAIDEGMIAGGVYPSCWRRDGNPEFAFDVQLRTEGRVVVVDRAPAYRQQEEAWKMLAPFPRGVPINVSDFVDATRRMAEWAQRQSPQCRFWINVRRDMPADTPNSEYLRVIGPLGNAASRHVPFYRVGG